MGVPPAVGGAIVKSRPEIRSTPDSRLGRKPQKHSWRGDNWVSHGPFGMSRQRSHLLPTRGTHDMQSLKCAKVKGTRGATSPSHKTRARPPPQQWRHSAAIVLLQIATMTNRNFRTKIQFGASVVIKARKTQGNWLVGRRT